MHVQYLVGASEFMTSVGQAATAEIVTCRRAGARVGWRGWSALVAVALALLSAFATFVVLADLTPIAPTHEVVVTLLLVNARHGLSSGRGHRRARSGASCRRAGAGGRRRGCTCASSPCSR